MNRLGFNSNVLGNQMAHSSRGSSVIGASIPVISVYNLSPTPPPPAGNYLITSTGAYLVDQSANKLIFV